AHLDALTYGREYIAVGSGDCGTDDCPPLITAESPLDMTLFWEARARVATAALRESQEGSHFGLAPDDRLVTLYLPDQTIHAV
ncbi:phage capsid protein, partial [Streptomyces sp. A73]|nr:phage capsid protein [Streptomyces sp. A73]